MILYLIRGTSGSGKTTLAQRIAPGSNVCTDMRCMLGSLLTGLIDQGVDVARVTK